MIVLMNTFLKKLEINIRINEHLLLFSTIFIACKDFWMIWLFNRSALSVNNESYSRSASCSLNLYLRFYFYHWTDTSAGGLLVSEGIVRPVVSTSILTWFIICFYYRNLQFLNIMIKINVLLSQTWVTLAYFAYPV